MGGIIGGGLSYFLTIKKQGNPSQNQLRIETAFGGGIGGALAGEVSVMIALWKDHTAGWDEAWPLFMGAMIFGGVVGSLSGSIFGRIFGSILLALPKNGR